MRKRYQNILKKHFHEQLVQTRAALNLTQSEMSGLLAMDDRSYIELDHGNSSCSALTLALFLIYCCPEPKRFLSELRQALETEANRAA